MAKTRAQTRKAPKGKKGAKKNRNFRKAGPYSKAKIQSETKLNKQIMEVSSLLTFTTPLISHLPFTRTLRLSYNPVLTQNGTDATNIANKDFIPNGTGYGQRIGRQVTLMSCRENYVLAVEHNGSVLNPPVYPRNVELRIVQGWVKEGINQFAELLTETPTMYSEFNWVKYKIIKDYIVSRKADYTGLNVAGNPYIDDGTGAEPPEYRVNKKPVPAYNDIKIRCSWNPNRVLKWNEDSTANPAAPAEYVGWAPFLMIYNPNDSVIQVRQKYVKNTITYKDL